MEFETDLDIILGENADFTQEATLKKGINRKTVWVIFCSAENENIYLIKDLNSGPVPFILIKTTDLAGFDESSHVVIDSIEYKFLPNGIETALPGMTKVSLKKVS